MVSLLLSSENITGFQGPLQTPGSFNLNSDYILLDYIDINV